MSKDPHGMIQGERVERDREQRGYKDFEEEAGGHDRGSTAVDLRSLVMLI
jgi:hypothetical protein